MVKKGTFKKKDFFLYKSLFLFTIDIKESLSQLKLQSKKLRKKF